jgi:hypothetical protein
MNDIKERNVSKTAEQGGQVDAIVSLRKAAEPLIKYLNENYHPHVTAIVTPTSVELLEGIMCEPKIFDFVKD